MRLRTKIAAAAGLAFSLATAAPALAQQIYVGPGYGAPPPYFGDHHHHLWHHGEFYHGPMDIVHHAKDLGLPRPPYGFAWIRTPHQFVLVNLNNGWVDHSVFRS